MKKLPGIILYLIILTLLIHLALLFLHGQREKNVTPHSSARNDSSSTLTPDGKKYRNEVYGFELTIPSTWTAFRDLEVKRRDDGTASIGFLFETSDEQYFNEYNCQGKCDVLFTISIHSHEQFNEIYEERLVTFGNQSGKSPVISVNERYVFSGANMGHFSSDPPSDLIQIKTELPLVYKSFRSF